MSSNTSWGLRVRNKVYKDISKFPRVDRERILMVIENLPLDPYDGDIEKIKGEDKIWRRRVGNYRISYEIISENKVVYVFNVERRTSSSY